MDRFTKRLPPLKAKLREWARERSRWIWAAVIASTGLAAAMANNPASSSVRGPNGGPAEDDGTAPLASSIDTEIPAGYVLVPIEVVNYEALDSVLGRFGVVDLFAAGLGQQRKSYQVASRIRILRAPRNPNHFAVLAPSEEAPGLVRHEGGFFVVVQNPESAGTKFEKRPPSGVAKARRHGRLRVEMQDE